MADRLNSYKNRGIVSLRFISELDSRVERASPTLTVPILAGKKDEYMKRMKDQTVELRKAKKEEQLSKRRNLVEHGNIGDSDGESISGVEQRAHASVPDMNELRQGIQLIKISLSP